MAIKIAFAQDLSGSFSDDISTVQGLISDILTGVKDFDSSAELAITSFIDKPKSPFGGTSDYVYSTDLALTGNAGDIQATYDGFSASGGADWEEAQLEAMLQIALRNSEIGWSNTDQKIILLFTDATYHKEGDNPGRKNNYDEILDGTPAGTGEDYPSVSELGFLLRQKGITPIFAVTSSNTLTYESLITDLGAGGGVVEITSDSSNIVAAVKSAVAKSVGLEHLSPLSGISFRENESFNLKVRLNQQPTANVSLTAQTSDTSEASINSGSLTFTPENWDTYQILELSGIDDTDVETNQKYTVEFSSFTSTDTNFSGYTPGSIFFTLTDDDLTPVSRGATLVATTASAVELSEDSTFKPSEESDTAKFATTGKSSVIATPKEIRDDIFYDFSEESELEIKIDSITLGSVSESTLSTYFKITEGSAVVQFDANFDGDYDDVTDTIFTFKGSYDLNKFSFAKTSDGVQVLYDRASASTGGGGGGGAPTPPATEDQDGEADATEDDTSTTLNPNPAQNPVLSISVPAEFAGGFDQITGIKANPELGESVGRLYTATFGRFPDLSGLLFWFDALNNGLTSINTVCEQFIASPEFLSRYGPDISNETYINNMYINALGRPAEAGGFAYWTDLMNNQNVSRADTLLGFANSPEHVSLFDILIN